MNALDVIMFGAQEKRIHKLVQDVGAPTGTRKRQNFGRLYLDILRGDE